jgi:DNA-binding beta-propeller fold protein YncE
LRCWPARTAYTASFINYDSAKEYLVYAHAARGPKEILAQVEEISRRTTGDKSIKVAYSNDGLYPYWWYLRDYPNKLWYQNKPTRELRDYPVIIAGEDVFDKIDAVVGVNFTRYEYMRLWWPNQDYWHMTWERLWGAISDPNMRAAIFKIWLNRDYSDYARLTGKEKAFTPEDWSPGAKVRMYIRNDIVSQIWNYGASPTTLSPEEIDPYASRIINQQPIQVIGGSGDQPGQFNAPRGIRTAPDGSLYIADSRNHRIQHLSPQGDVLHVWGSFADRSQGAAPGGTFYEPWDVAIGLDGSVFVSDTWNHRIQKFTADGRFLKEWGYFGQGEAPDAFWGPRGLAVDRLGYLYVMDTGNDRVVVFDEEGNFISQFGGQGLEVGKFDEPVDIAIDPNSGSIFITDAWNQRIQQFAPGARAAFFTPIAAWDIRGWAGQSLDNKPYLAISPTSGHLFITDPEAPRILEFDQAGNFIRGWGEYSTGTDGFGLASGVTVTQNGEVWVSDGANNVLLRFSLP